MNGSKTYSSVKNQVVKDLSKQNDSKKAFDVIVIGTGSMGSSACYHLASQGYSVLGIDQYEVPHELGSHTGQTRIIRKAYFEHPDYVPLLELAYKNWNKIEEESDVQLYFKTGLLYFGESDNQLISGIRGTSSKYKIKVDEFTSTQLENQYPQFNIPENYERMVEPDAGFLIPELSILVFLEQALQKGAVIKQNEKVLSYSSENSCIRVKTDKETYECKKLIITAGAWTGQIIPDLTPQLKVTKQMIAWVKPKKRESFELGKFPCWMVVPPKGKGLYYGFPFLPEDHFEPPTGIKIAHHYPGDVANLDHVNRTISKEEEQNLIQFIAEFIPDGYKTLSASKTCLYTYSPDEHFIIDNLPENENVIIASGFSGHGFKFSSAIGEIVSDLAIRAGTEYQIDFLRASRFEKH